MVYISRSPSPLQDSCIFTKLHVYNVVANYKVYYSNKLVLKSATTDHLKLFSDNTGLLLFEIVAASQ